MIKLIALLLTITIANANIFPFLLPDEGSHFNHHLQSLLKKSQKEIVILTASMHYPSLNKSIFQALSHGVHLSIIANNLKNDPLRFVAYRNVLLYRNTTHSITDTVILIDSTHICHIPDELDEKNLMGTISNIWCSDESSLILPLQKHINLLKKRSVPYLE